MVKLLYLHGIGKRATDRPWLTALKESLVATGFSALSADQVIAPNYYSLLMTDGIKAKAPRKTHKHPKDAVTLDVRLDYEARQADVERMLQGKQVARAFGFNLVNLAMAAPRTTNRTRGAN